MIKYLHIIFVIVLSSTTLAIAQTTESTQAKKNTPLFSQGVFMATLYDETILHLENWNDLKGKEGDIRALSIQFKGLKNLPQELLMLPNLESIDLSHNQIESLNVSFFETFKKLKKIYLNNNSLPSSQLKELELKFPKLKVYYLPEHFN